MANAQLQPVQPDAPLAEAAAATLTPRLRRVTRLVRQLRKAQDIAERDVHRLRVAVRDAVASIDAFETATNGKRTGKLRADLRGLRKSAGAARRADVLTPIAAARTGSSTAEVAAAGGYLLARLDEERRTARATLADALRSADLGRMKRHRKRLLASFDSAPLSIGDLAETAIGRARNVVREASTADLTDAASLHSLRIACKRLRYTIEAFDRAADPNESACLVPLREAQDRLGRFNDVCDAMALVECEIARARAAGAPSSLVTGLSWMRVGLIDERNALRAGFLLWWRQAGPRILGQTPQDSAPPAPAPSPEIARKERA